MVADILLKSPQEKKEGAGMCKKCKQSVIKEKCAYLAKIKGNIWFYFATYIDNGIFDFYQ